MGANSSHPKRTRPWLQFSLRTFLIALSLAAVGLAMFMWPAQRQRRSVAAITSVGGRVTYRESRWLPKSPFLHRLLTFGLPKDCCLTTDFVVFDRCTGWNEELPVHLSALTSAECFDLSNTPVTDMDLKYLHGLDQLEVLYLSNTAVTDAGLAHLKSLTSLRVIVLYKTAITDAGLASLKGLSKLDDIEIQGTHVTDAGLVHLKELTNLNWLDLSGTGVTDAGLTHLQQMPNLDTVIVDATQVTEEGRDAFLQALPVHRAQAAAQADLEERRRAAQPSSRGQAE